MKAIVRNVLSVLAALVVGNIVNMALITIGPMVIPPPEGADVTTPEGLRDSMHLFTPAHFLFPFLAHALGTLAGAFVAAKLVTSHPRRYAVAIGLFFLAGGIAMAVLAGGPVWFLATDLIVAYIPMALLGAKLAGPRPAADAPAD